MFLISVNFCAFSVSYFLICFLTSLFSGKITDDFLDCNLIDGNVTKPASVNKSAIKLFLKSDFSSGILSKSPEFDF